MSTEKRCKEIISIIKDNLSVNEKESLVELTLLRVMLYEEVVKSSKLIMPNTASKFLHDIKESEHQKIREIEYVYGLEVEELVSDTCKVCGTTEFLCGHNRRG